MELVLDCIFTILCTIAVTCGFFYFYVTQKFNYWKDKGVVFVKPVFPFGSLSNFYLGKVHIGKVFEKFYQEFKNEPYFGVYEGRRPTLVLRDPELIKRILIKDFQHFNARLTLPLNNKSDYVSNHLFNMRGQEWKRMRLKLTPTFTSGKMKIMFFLMKKCGDQLKDHVAKHLETESTIDVKDVLARFTIDIIASCAFGLEVNSLSDKNCEFYQMGIKIFTPTTYAMVRRVIFTAFPLLTTIYPPRLVDSGVSHFLTNIIRNTVQYREKNKVNRNDFLDLLIKVNESSNGEERNYEKYKQRKSEVDTSEDDKGLTIEEITAQAFIFFAAGFETASSTITFCLYELARNPDIQDRLYQEIKQVLTQHDDLTYQALQEMAYTDQVVNETLRLYASLSLLHRTCTKTYKVPNSDLVLDEGQRVIIPAFAIHHDPQYYPDPYRFDPERFTPEQVSARHPCVHLPFGEGPRMCIGMRFGLLQTKIGLTEMVLNFKFGLSAETPVPIVLHKTAFVSQPQKPILLHIASRKD